MENGFTDIPKEYYQSLYTFSKSGKARQFSAFLEQIDDNMIVITTTTGYVGGKMSNKKTYIKKAFQKRSLLQQAVLELQSKINTKIDEGYKTIDMYIDKYYNGKNIFGSERATIQAIQGNDDIPKFDSNRDWIPRPMLAQTYKPNKNGHDIINYLIQPKLDGVRCLAGIRPDGSIFLMSRGGNYYYMPHIEREVKILFDNLDVLENTTFLENNKLDYILDGELYIHNVSFEKISGLCRLGLNQDSMQSSLIDEKSIIEYHIYDIFNPNRLEDLLHSQYYRTGIIYDLFTKKLNLNSIVFVNTEIVESEQAIQEYHDEVVNEGYEGAILRDMHGKYEPGDRSNNLLKVKRFKEAEYRIVGYKIDPKQTVEDSFVFQLYSPKGDFYCRPKGTAALKRKYHQDIDKLIGKRATVRYLDITNTGLPGKAHVKSIRNYE